jgi:hypothetical protein
LRIWTIVCSSFTFRKSKVSDISSEDSYFEYPGFLQLIDKIYHKYNRNYGYGV